MATPPHILTKIKFLFNLKQSPNPHESESAGALAEKLINKYGVSEEELQSIADKEPLYTENELLFHTFSIVGWMSQLALCVSKHFECYIVQETISSALGQQEYNYYIYGEDEQVAYVKFAYATFHKKIHHLIDTKCIGRGEISIDSYCIGLVDAIKQNIEMNGIEIPISKRPSRSIEVKQIVVDNTKQALTIPNKDKAAPLEEKIDVKGQSLIKDIGAYYRGVIDGQGISLQDILELEVENEQAEQLKADPTE
jgi:Protein of unknown function (DUF2786)